MVSQKYGKYCGFNFGCKPFDQIACDDLDECCKKRDRCTKEKQSRLDCICTKNMLKCLYDVEKNQTNLDNRCQYKSKINQMAIKIMKLVIKIKQTSKRIYVIILRFFVWVFFYYSRIFLLIQRY